MPRVGPEPTFRRLHDPPRHADYRHDQRIVCTRTCATARSVGGRVRARSPSLCVRLLPTLGTPRPDAGLNAPAPADTRPPAVLTRCGAGMTGSGPRAIDWRTDHSGADPRRA